jgi:hypothetical protein
VPGLCLDVAADLTFHRGRERFVERGGDDIAQKREAEPPSDERGEDEDHGVDREGEQRMAAERLVCADQPEGAPGVQKPAGERGAGWRGVAGGMQWEASVPLGEGGVTTL